MCITDGNIEYFVLENKIYKIPFWQKTWVVF